MRGARAALAAAILAAAVVSAALFSLLESPPSPASDSPAPAKREAPPPHYVGRQACASCHVAEDAAWKGSDHERAMDTAVEATVLGRFEGDSLVHKKAVSRFFRRDGGFWMRTEGADGAPADFRIEYVFGIRPLQQYLTRFPGGRLQALPLAWDTRKQAWFQLHTEKRDPNDWLHWTRDAHNWNGMCADCHSTGLQRGYQPATGEFRTTWKEINVSCEACHGPGSEHVRLGGKLPMPISFSGDGPRTLRAPAGAEVKRAARAEIDACARCHARRSPLQKDFAAAKQFLDGFAPELLREGVYHADGQILDEDYEYGSFLQSRMHAAGVRCSDCHEPHTLKTRAPGNALCLRCHEPARFDVPAHHRHGQGSRGSLCVECHMPSKYYMQVDLRRDHSLRIPRPDLSVRFGTPNACNACHEDKSPQWAADWIVAWHGPTRKPHFSERLAHGRSRAPGADTSLAHLAGDTSSPAIARATALSLLSNWMNGLAAAAAASAIRDVDPLVRREAALTLEFAPPPQRLTLVLPLLKDTVRAVRVAAAQALAGLDPQIPDSLRAAHARAAAEYRESLEASAFFPGGRFNLARHHETAGRADSAVAEYLAALALDNRLIQARVNLAQLFDRLGRKAEAEAHLREALRLNPEYAESAYLLGLLLGGLGRSDSAAKFLGLAAKRMPDNPRVHYNRGLILHRLGRLAEAEASLVEALRLSPGDPDLANAVAWIRAQRKAP